MKIFRRLISLLTVFSIIATFSLNVNATTITSTTDKSDVKIDSSDYKLDNLPSYLLDAIQSNNKEVESLDLENILDEFAVITNNKDGSKTHYRFDVPIKYKDQDKISFRNPKIERSNLIKRTFTKHEYESVKNDFKSYFPKKLQDGILMEYKDYSVKISTIDDIEYSSDNILVNTKENTAKYTNVFSAKDHVEYIPILNGLKENIVLYEYTGQNTFKFKITIEGLTPAFMAGESIPLLDKASNELVMAIGQVDAKDSYVGENENNDTHFSLYNELILEKTEKDSEYELTVVVDKEFLESESTVYPVIIDPTINVTDTSLMRDTTVYSAKPTSQTFYTSSYNIVGNHGSSYGEGIPFIQVLTMHCYKHINPNNITSAYYHVREGSGKTNSSVIEIHDTYSPWEENTITYNNMPGTYNYDSSKNVTVTTSKWYDFNITGLVKAWLRTELNEGGWNQTYGFALKAQNSSASSKHFCSANHGTYPPSMIVNYNEDSSISNGVYFIRNIWTNKYLDVENPTLNSGSGIENVIVYPLHGGTNQQWRVERQSNGYYKLYSQFQFASPKCLDITGDNIDVYDSNSNGEYLLFRIVSNNDGTHRIMPVYNDNMFRALDVNGSSDSADYQRNVISYAYWADANQKWVFEKSNLGNNVPNSNFSVARYNGQIYLDYTKPLNKLLSNAVAECEDHRCMNWTQYCTWCYNISPLITPSISEHLGLQIGSFSWFYGKVNHAAAWDIKRQQQWNNALPNIPYLGNSGEFIFRGYKITAEDMGNIMYGYTGRATGFSEITLYWGGGVAKQGSLNNSAVTTAPYYGDDANDHYNIELGYDLFNSDYPNYPAVGYEGIPVEPGILAAVADLILNPGT